MFKQNLKNKLKFHQIENINNFLLHFWYKQLVIELTGCM